MLPANHAIPGLQSGSFMVTRFQNGERPKSRVHFYGSTGNVCVIIIPSFCSSTKTYFYLFLKRALEKASFGT